ncbi:MAG: iron-sulfur cluster repair di-iron protein [Candidatus Marinimicrobia bacterium]|jgi:regulator of cell morphogenesis and NO signaling|nr:iron-sulfur cluster repair di-iron protein [Candidatus Neomarinimicrobiota bacterium]MBT3692066.1 iron-sulfur cluster repair di-iron protein [Candidatus Neomarinimicrobiota bacterium]MBT4144912.1 iron-sulfur cluster repair di-iron protein [Candidatus Neomarinimicrobiota bacterium]MBT4593936.1 iron-sulfur cluster repair di-iron protein [Candidatus Neomarinimicrobiota bacterium]MBT4990111.1 iron-sulfur cluster repair di-iron protein [Candidatus Neomarinimicrobiota bacterium]
MKEKTVGEIVSDDIRTATVFKKHGLDFCCGGGEKLETACQKKGADLEAIVADLELVLSDEKSSDDFQAMPLNKLVDHIFNTHHQFIYENGPVTAEFINKVARVHGERHPETVEVAKLFNDLMQDLHQHMMKEERILFPYIKQMVQDSFSNGAFVNGPISVMMAEHDTAGEILKKMNALTSGYEPPVDGCNTYRAAYANIQALEDDIHLHIHLENNILFPKALELEEQLLG